VILLSLLAATPALTQCIDCDNDGYAWPEDCNDDSPLIFPGAQQHCNGFDNDCDTLVDLPTGCPDSCPLPDSALPPLPIQPQALAWNGVYVGAVWVDTTHRNIYLSFLDENGQRIAPDTLIHVAPEYVAAAALAWTGSDYAIVWSERSPLNEADILYFMTVSEGGVPLIPLHPLLDGSQLVPRPTYSYPHIFWNGNRFLVTWNNDGPNAFLVLTRDGVPIGPLTQLPRSCGYPTDVSVVWTHQEWGLAYADACVGASQLLHLRISADGTLAAQPTLVDFSTNSLPHRRPSLVWNGTESALFFLGSTGFRIVRIDISGNIVGPPVVFSNIQGGEISASWTGNEYGLIVEDKFYRFASDFTLLGTRSNLVTAPMYTSHSLVWMGRAYIGYSSRISCDCADQDGDGWSSCQDCNDSRALINPSASESCDHVDNNCNGLADEDPLGRDSDNDGIGDLCDTCPTGYNPNQDDRDHDGRGDLCDNCSLVPNFDQLDTDNDTRGDRCDNCRYAYNFFQDDLDSDQIGDICDNCPEDSDASQSDIDNDSTGDICDPDDGQIMVIFPDRFTVSWQDEVGNTSFNVYRGDLAVLRQTGQYTQDPTVTPLASRNCDVTDVWLLDAVDLPVGKGVFFLVTGNGSGGESPLGNSSSGNPRPNSNPCP
jgi:hypothetical protein